MVALSYISVSSVFGMLVLLWQDMAEGPKVHRLLLPREGMPAEKMLDTLHTNAQSLSHPTMAGLGEGISRFLDGEDLRFPLDLLALETCSVFQQRVLQAEHAIPRGWVSTYGRIAKELGLPGATQAVGRALASNPFPILIPCHRTVRSDGEVGGYQGGQQMKRVLLELEGVRFSPSGKMVMDKVYY